MNSVSLVGRIANNLELKYTQTSNVAFCRFRLAVGRSFKKNDGTQDTDFIDIEVWRQQAENLVKYQTKGLLLSVSGRLETRNYEKDGRKVFQTFITATDIGYLSPRSEQAQQQSVTSTNQYAQMEKPSFDTSFDSGIDVTDDDLPF